MELISSRILLLLVSLISSLLLSWAQVNPAVENICVKTDNPALCFTTILPNLPDGTTCDPITALHIEIKACLNRTHEAVTQLKKMVANPSTSKPDISSIQVCQEVYESALDDLNSATEAIATHDVPSVKTRLSGVITFFGTCDDVVAESPGFKLPLKDEDVDTLRMLASNCLGISYCSIYYFCVS